MSGAIQPITPYQAPDILGQAGQYAGLQNQLLQNQTGQQNLQLQQYQIQQAQLAQTQARLGAYKSVLAPLMRLGPNVQPSDVYTALRGLSSVPGMPTDEIAADVANTMPVMDPKHASDPGYQQQYGRALQGWVQNQAGSTLTPEAQFTAFRPSITMVDQGGVTTPTDTNPSTNPGITGQSFPMSLTPAQAVSGQNFTTPSGTPYFESNAQIANQTGQGNLVAGGGGSGGGAPAGNSIFGNGRLPGRGAPYNGPQAGSTAPSAPSGSNVPPGTIQSGLPPGQADAAQVTAQNSAQQYAAMTNQTATIPMQKATLQNMLSLVGTPGGFESGPGNTEFRQTVAGINRAFGTNFDTSGVAAGENFAKMAQNLANQQVSSLGAGSNEKLEATMAATPNPHLSTPGNVQIIHKLLGNQDAVGAWNTAGANYAKANGPASYSDFVSSMAKTFDPRAFQLHYESPEEQAATLKSMSPSELAQFRLSYNQMATQGMFAQYQQPSQGTSPSGAVPNPAAPGQTYVPAVPTGQ